MSWQANTSAGPAKKLIHRAITDREMEREGHTCTDTHTEREREGGMQRDMQASIRVCHLDDGIPQELHGGRRRRAPHLFFCPHEDDQPSVAVSSEKRMSRVRLHPPPTTNTARS